MSDALKLKRNKDKLLNCDKHKFVKFKSNLPLPFRHEVHGVCENCGGNMDIDRVEFYCRGYMDAGGRMRDVLPSGIIGVDGE